MSPLALCCKFVVEFVYIKFCNFIPRLARDSPPKLDSRFWDPPLLHKYLSNGPFFHHLHGWIHNFLSQFVMSFYSNEGDALDGHKHSSTHMWASLWSLLWYFIGISPFHSHAQLCSTPPKTRTVLIFRIGGKITRQRTRPVFFNSKNACKIKFGCLPSAQTSCLTSA